MLDTATVQIIKATVPALQIYANDITSHFYPLLFAQHPEVLPFFNQTNQDKGTQPKALANAVIAYGANIDELGNLSDAVSKIVQKHTALGILPEQYDAVGSCLLQAIKAVLGDAATDEVIDAWAKAYGQLANILIAAEESIYTANEQKEGSWRGEREFILVKREDESSLITSFYFQPFDNQGLPDFEAGQFITIVFDDLDGVAMRRNYSLSDAAGKDYLRISVKREPNGIVSSHLHNNIQLGDKVKLRAPSGDFILRKNAKPLVLLTGGVGITPAISMLNTEAESGRDIRFIHAAINSEVHAFKQHVDELAAVNSNIKPLYIYSQPEAQCQPHVTGFIDATIIEAQLPADRDVEFYLLGPVGFMKVALAIATSLGVPANQIHYEFFGPAESLTA
ncbi:NO-inducible flavohemoprotein [Shewanella ulleungensis]|uniref:nitric oxide dioxygenase n=1 Tax=Shewanella ulleungensis TaxID=2282699 RepID=A0ABQ2QMQ7_9GAMM|nr:NO-inducible flavohemoprotein [Shewanella ulleungensis]MCL1150265.1 NO-inducible flavohemoprotein [Shewanella ulleungensis]GGP88672.1 flavohemoprotein [Shewanella ulleungensis]